MAKLPFFAACGFSLRKFPSMLVRVVTLTLFLKEHDLKFTRNLIVEPRKYNESGSNKIIISVGPILEVLRLTQLRCLQVIISAPGKGDLILNE